MKRLFNKREYNKLDEMEKSIFAKAQKTAYTYVLIVLMIWTFYESYKVLAHDTTLYIFPFFLFLSTFFIQNIVEFYLKKQAIKGETEYKDPNPVGKILLNLVACVLIGMVITSFIVYFVMLR